MAEYHRHDIAMLVRNPYTNDSRVEKEAATLRDAGHRVTVVADARPDLPAEEVRDGIAVKRVARRASAIPGLRYMAHELRLARVLSRLYASVLHAHDSNALLPVVLAASRRRIPVVYDAHDLWLGRPRRERSRLYFAANQALYTIVERMLIPRAAATITVSGPIAEHLRRRYRLNQVELVPNYPPVTPFRRSEIRSLPGGDSLDPGRPIVLYLGGFMGGRGLEMLVDAMALVPDAQLVLLGDGALTGNLRRRAEMLAIGDRVHVLAPVPTGDVVAFTASADLGVSPIVPSCLNYRYSLPNKLFQYMAAGIPVVASDFPQVREVVVGSGAGLVVDTRRPGAIAAAINQLLGDRDEARRMGERGRVAIEQKYNWSVSASALLRTYDRIPRRTMSG